MAIHGKYSEAELNFLIQNYPTMEWDELISGLAKISGHKRSKASILAKASKLKIPRLIYGNYSEHEDNLIRQVYASSVETTLLKNLQKLVDDEMPHRTLKAVISRANTLKLKLRQEWTEDEIAFLKNNYHKLTIKQLANELPKRSKTAIYNKMIKLNLLDAPTFAYSEQDIAFIKDNYANMSDEEIGKILHRSANGIKECRRKYGIYRQDPNQGTNYKCILRFVQAHNSDWKKRSMKACNYRCIITGEIFDDIHHLYSKNMILNAALDRLGIPYDLDINTCSDETKEKILKEFLIEQDKYPLGVCLKANLHHRFHAKYGFGYNTPEQFEEYVKAITQSGIHNKVA